MKTTIKTIVLAAASLFAAMSCQKEESGTQDLVKEGETIQVSINAGLGDFVAADATKATATPVVRLEWSHTDKVQAYYGTAQVGIDLSVKPSENGIFAKLSGTITSQEGMDDASIITFVYSNGCTVENNLTFNFSSQGTTIPFVAYATVKYGEIRSGLSDKMVEFKFATSVMKIAATNLAGGGNISNATISGINTKVTLTPQISNETVTIIGSEPNTITKTADIDASSDKTRAIFTVGLVPEDENSNRKLTINGCEADLTSSAIAASKSYTTPCAFEGVKNVDYVIIGEKKWATKNLGANDINGYGNFYSWGNQTTTNSNFSQVNYNKTEGHSINGTTYIWNKMKHDAAYYEYGGNWRMPSDGDFIALDIACGGDGSANQHISAITGDDIDEEGKVKQGKYWLEANQQVLSDIDELKEITASGLLYSDGKNYLFFPAAGYKYEKNHTYKDTDGFYWSSTLNSNDIQHAYKLRFSSNNVTPNLTDLRFSGFSVRPVSD